MDNTIPERNSATSDIQEKEQRSFNVGFSDAVEILLTFICVFITLHQLFGSGLHFATTLLHLGYSAFVITKTALREKQFRKAAIFPVILLSAIILSHSLFTAFEGLRLGVSCCLFGYTLCALTGTKGFPPERYSDIFTQLTALFIFPLKNILLPIKAFFGKIKGRKIKKWAGIIFGLLLGIPVFLLTAQLLADADFSFGYMFSKITVTLLDKLGKIADTFISEYLNLILTVIMTPFIYAFNFSAEQKLTREFTEKDHIERFFSRLSFVGNNVFIGFYSLVSLGYIMFLLSQLSYLFSVFSGTPAYGYTVSSYARQGFFEMSAVAVINLCLIFAGAVFAKRKDRKEISAVIKGFTVFFCVFTVFLIIIASAKMLLYIGTYGLTEKRIAVLLFDLLLLYTFIFIPVRLFKKSFPLIKSVYYSAAVLVCFLLVFSIDALSATCNTSMYLKNVPDTSDIHTIRLCNSGYTAIKNLEKLTLVSDTKVSDTAKSCMYIIYENHESWNHKRKTVDDALLCRYIKENEEILKSYQNKEDYYEPDNTEKTDITQNYSDIYISLRFDLPDIITSIKTENSVLQKTAEFTKTPESYLPGSWLSINNETIIAKITLTLHSNEKQTFILSKEDKIPDENENILYIGDTDYFSGVFKAKPDGSIYLVPDE